MTNKKIISLLLISLVFIAAKSDSSSWNSYSNDGYNSKSAAANVQSSEKMDPRAAAIKKLAENPEALKRMANLARALENARAQKSAQPEAAIESSTRETAKAKKEKSSLW